MFKEQKLISCIFKVTVLLALTNFGHAYEVVTKFVDNENPEPEIDGAPEESIELGGVTVNNNEMDASTCNFNPLSGNFIMNCELGYTISYTYIKKGEPYTFQGDASTGISEIMPASEELEKCITEAKAGVESPNIATILEKCPDIHAYFKNPALTSVTLPCVSKPDEEEEVPKLAIKVQLFTIAARRVLDLI